MLCVVLTNILICSFVFAFFFKCTVDHPYLHVLTHSFPTRRSSDLTPLADPGLWRTRTTPAASHQRPSRDCIASAQVTIPWRDSSSRRNDTRSEEHTSELQSLMRISYAVFCLKKKNQQTITQILNNNKYALKPLTQIIKQKHN